MNSKYLCPYCTAAFDAHEALKAHVVADHAAEPLPRPVGAITITVNGQRYEHSVEPNVTLYTLIHDRMGLTGAKMFCDRGACGSCTVIMDGRPVLSCMTLAIECDGKTHRDGGGDRGFQPSPHRNLRQAPLHAVRLLHARLRGHREGVARQKPRPHGRGDTGGPLRQPLPVRDLSSAPQGGSRGGRDPKGRGLNERD